MTDKNKEIYEVFELKNLFKNLLERKWWVLGFFIATLAISLAISFFRVPQYMVQSAVRVERNYFYYNDEIYRFFPEESSNLWIFPSSNAYNLETRTLVEIKSKLMSDEFLKELELYLDNRFLVGILKDIIDVDTYIEERYLKITVVYKNAEDALLIINSATDLLEEIRSSELEDSWSDLVTNSDEQIKKLENEIIEIPVMDEAAADLLTEEEIDSKTDDLRVLKGINDQLQNKEIFTDRIDVLNKPGKDDVVELNNLKRDILFSLITAFVMGILAGIISSYFINLKKQK